MEIVIIPDGEAWQTQVCCSVVAVRARTEAPFHHRLVGLTLNGENLVRNIGRATTYLPARAILKQGDVLAASGGTVYVSLGEVVK